MLRISPDNYEHISVRKSPENYETWQMRRKVAGKNYRNNSWWAANTLDADGTLHDAGSNLGLHWLLRSLCQANLGEHGIL